MVRHPRQHISPGPQIYNGSRFLCGFGDYVQYYFIFSIFDEAIRVLGAIENAHVKEGSCLKTSPCGSPLSFNDQARNYPGQRRLGAYVVEVRERFCYCLSGHLSTIRRMDNGGKLVSIFCQQHDAFYYRSVQLALVLLL